MIRYAFIVLISLLCACIAIYTIWTIRVSNSRSNDLLKEFRKVDRSLSKSNDSLQNSTGVGAFKKDSAYVPEVELSIRVNSIATCIDSIKHDLFILTNKKEGVPFSYPDMNKLVVLKNNLRSYNSFIQEHFGNKPGIKTADFINMEDIKSEGKLVPWEIYFFKNTNIFAAITELTFINTQVQKLQQKAIR
ncbi:MAG: hypothetical protein ABI666_10590 [Ferruginibacter sp.]